MFAVAWKEAIIGLCVLGITGLITIKINLAVRRVAALIPEESRRLSEGIERVARNKLYILISKTQSKEYYNLINTAIRTTKNLVTGQFLASLNGVIPPFLGTVLLAGIILVSQSYFHTPGSSLVAFLYLFVRFVQQLASVAHEIGAMNNFYPQYKETINMVENLQSSDYKKAISLFSEQKILFDFDKILERTSLMEKHSAIGELSQDLSPPRITINNLNFGWPNENSIIQNMSITVEPGEHLGIVGPSGVGKSTLLYLIFGLLKPRSGNIQIDGVDSKNFFELKHMPIGYVGAEAFLIRGSIKENLLYGMKENSISDEEISSALNQAYLLDDIKLLKHGLDHQINENAEGLSAGQKQRLALARAFLRKPKLLILDEASANLDIESEKQITASVNNLKGTCTVIIVSHREGILKGIDKRVTLDRQFGIPEQIKPVFGAP